MVEPKDIAQIALAEHFDNPAYAIDFFNFFYLLLRHENESTPNYGTRFIAIFKTIRKEFIVASELISDHYSLERQQADLAKILRRILLKEFEKSESQSNLIKSPSGEQFLLKLAQLVSELSEPHVNQLYRRLIKLFEIPPEGIYAALLEQPVSELIRLNLTATWLDDTQVARATVEDADIVEDLSVAEGAQKRRGRKPNESLAEELVLKSEFTNIRDITFRLIALPEDQLEVSAYYLLTNNDIINPFAAQDILNTLFEMEQWQKVTVSQLMEVIVYRGNLRSYWHLRRMSITKSNFVRIVKLLTSLGWITNVENITEQRLQQEVVAEASENQQAKLLYSKFAKTTFQVLKVPETLLQSNVRDVFTQFMPSGSITRITVSLNVRTIEALINCISEKESEALLPPEKILYDNFKKGTYVRMIIALLQLGIIYSPDIAITEPTADESPRLDMKTEASAEVEELQTLHEDSHVSDLVIEQDATLTIPATVGEDDISELFTHEDPGASPVDEYQVYPRITVAPEHARGEATDGLNYPTTKELSDFVNDYSKVRDLVYNFPQSLFEITIEQAFTLSDDAVLEYIRNDFQKINTIHTLGDLIGKIRRMCDAEENYLFWSSQMLKKTRGHRAFKEVFAVLIAYYKRHLAVNRNEIEAEPSNIEEARTVKKERRVEFHALNYIVKPDQYVPAQNFSRRLHVAFKLPSPSISAHGEATILKGLDLEEKSTCEELLSKVIVKGTNVIMDLSQFQQKYPNMGLQSYRNILQVLLHHKLIQEAK